MLEITEMKQEDLDAVSAIEAEVFSVPWSRKGFADTLVMDNVIFLVAHEDEKVKGYCGVYQAADEGEITNVAVAPEYRKNRIAGRLLEELLKRAEERGTCRFVLEVRCSNKAAIHLYEKYGFSIQGRRKGFYEQPKEDAYIMTREKE